MKQVTIDSGTQGELDGSATGCLSAVGAGVDHETESLWITAVIQALRTGFSCLCAVDPSAYVAFPPARSSRVESPSSPLLDTLDHFLHQVVGDPEVEQDFYGTTTPEEMISAPCSEAATPSTGLPAVIPATRSDTYRRSLAADARDAQSSAFLNQADISTRQRLCLLWKRFDQPTNLRGRNSKTQFGSNA